MVRTGSPLSKQLLSDQRLAERGNTGRSRFGPIKTGFDRTAFVAPQMMFASNSPYSPFFTSGLLSHSIFDGIRRGSLPTDSPKDVQPPFIFSNQPEYRSFLSLDLAESQSMRSASLKRTPPLVFCLSILSHSSSFFRKPSDSDSLRSIPSPKPVPASTLPEVPKSAAPRLPSLTPIPALEVPEVPLPSLNISRTPAPQAIRRLSVATKATSSSISTRVRKSNRSQALARLEGRSKPVPITLHIKPPKPQQFNFMNMSDDDDESDEECICLNLDHVFSNPVLEPEDVVLPTSRAPKSASFPSQNDSFLVSSSHSVRRHKTQVPSTKDWLHLTSFMDLHTDDDSSSWALRSFIQVANVS